MFKAISSRLVMKIYNPWMREKFVAKYLPTASTWFYAKQVMLTGRLHEPRCEKKSLRVFRQINFSVRMFNSLTWPHVYFFDWFPLSLPLT